MLVKLSPKDVTRFKIACEAVDVSIKQEKNYGNKTVLIVAIKHASQLYEAGLIEASLPSDAELKTAIEESEKKATLEQVANSIENKNDVETSDGKGKKK